jgi:hypothetical protein
LIGYRNWQNYEIAKAKELGKKLIAVQINKDFGYPDELRGVNAKRIYSFNPRDIFEAVRNS